MNQIIRYDASGVRWTAPGAGQLKLEGGDIHLWNLCPSHAGAKDLEPAERARYQRIVHEEAKISYVTAQVGLRRVAARYRGEAPKNVILHRGPQGKPHLSGGPEFNLSHTAGKVFAAFSTQPVGLDIESADRKVHAEGLAEKFFSQKENEYLLRIRPERRNQTFLRFWVGKEATVKLSGDGIFLGLREAEVELGEGGVSRGRYRGREVWLQEFSPGGNLLACLATWQPGEVKCFFRL